jgi:hypothetical protein
LLNTGGLGFSVLGKLDTNDDTINFFLLPLQR